MKEETKEKPSVGKKEGLKDNPEDTKPTDEEKEDEQNEGPPKDTEAVQKLNLGETEKVDKPKGGQEDGEDDKQPDSSQGVGGDPQV